MTDHGGGSSAIPALLLAMYRTFKYDPRAIAFLREEYIKIRRELYQHSSADATLMIEKELDLLDYEKSTSANQCDGCRRGLPLENGVHKGAGYDMIGCTAHLYHKEK